MTLSPDIPGSPQVQTLADLIATAHTTARPVAEVSEAARIGSRDEAYAVQDLVATGLGKIVGWKVGRRGPTGATSHAPLFDTRLLPSGTLVPRDRFRSWLLESELMFRLGRDLIETDKPYTRDDIVSAIQSVIVVFEIVDSRFAGYPDVDPLLILADGLSHGAMVLGAEIALPHPAQFEHSPIELTIDGQSVVDRHGGNPAGDIIDLVTQFANERAAAGGGLTAGTFVTTGTYSGMQFLAPGGHAIARFAGIGQVEIRRSAD